MGPTRILSPPGIPPASLVGYFPAAAAATTTIGVLFLGYFMRDGEN